MPCWRQSSPPATVFLGALTLRVTFGLAPLDRSLAGFANTASAVFLFPIALSIADQLGVSFMPFAIALMTGTVGAAITPAAYQTNLMVYGPGEYEFMDFVKVGIPLTIMVGVITVWLAPIFFPF